MVWILTWETNGWVGILPVTGYFDVVLSRIFSHLKTYTYNVVYIWKWNEVPQRTCITECMHTFVLNSFQLWQCPWFEKKNLYNCQVQVLIFCEGNQPNPGFRAVSERNSYPKLTSMLRRCSWPTHWLTVVSMHRTLPWNQYSNSSRHPIF